MVVDIKSMLDESIEFMQSSGAKSLIIVINKQDFKKLIHLEGFTKINMNFRHKPAGIYNNLEVWIDNLAIDLYVIDKNTYAVFELDKHWLDDTDTNEYITALLRLHNKYPKKLGNITELS